MRQALVTGGCGFIGSHLVAALAKQGARVCVLDNLSSGYLENLPDGFPSDQVFQEEIQVVTASHPAVIGTDTLFHLAARPSVPVSIRDPLGTFQVNVVGTHNLLTAAREAGVRRVVIASSSSVYGDRPELPKDEEHAPRPLSPYAAQKLSAEQIGMAYSRSLGLEVVALRFFNVFGPRQDPSSAYAAAVAAFLGAALAGRPPTIYGDGEQTRDFTYVGDVVRACLSAATAPEAKSQVINVARGEQVSVNELCDSVLRICERDDLKPVYLARRVGDVRDSVAAIAKAKELLAWEPEVSLEEGLRHTVAWARDVRLKGH